MLTQIQLNPKQDEYIFAPDEFVCIKGTWGCGKSLAALLAADRECMEHPGNLYLVFRKEWVDLRDSTLRDWEDMIGRSVNGSNEVRYKNKSILMFRHGDDLNSLKNINLGGALMVQAEEMTEDDFWWVKGRLRRPQGTRQLRIECNYDGQNWIYNLFNQKKIGRLITTNTFDNEKNLPKDYIPGLMKLPKRLQERHLYGSDADMEGAVWDEFSQARHVIDPFIPPSSWEQLIVLDHGVTNPTAVLFGAVDRDGRVFVYDEHYEAEKVISHHASKIKERAVHPSCDWLADPSIFAKINSKNGKLYSVADEYSEQGINFRPADNDVLGGLNRVNEYFKNDMLFITRNCVHTLEEVPNYKWMRIKIGQQKNEPDRPVKKRDHTCDALKYMIASRPSITRAEREPIKKFSEADFERMEEQQYEHYEVA